MRMLAFVGTLLVGSAGVASAADQGTRAGDAVFDWSGAYAGIHLGYGWGDSDFVDDEYNGAPPTFPTVRWGVKSDGVLGGIHAGYNWQYDRVVFGFEGELGYLDLKGKRLQPGTDPFNVPYDAHGAVAGGWYAGVSARLGYAFGRALLYAKGGAVYSGTELRFVDACTTAPCFIGTIDAREEVKWGYQVGGGIEHAVAANWTIRAEYAYLDFGRATITGRGAGGPFEGVIYSTHADLSVHTVRIAASYKF